ncbi:MAG: type I 3-dehydroquinate dehydratase [Chloroflexota bacterium]|nr:MAG: type I 3-dehydroquinate dehydratase [Chloroflexota bacterium]
MRKQKLTEVPRPFICGVIQEEDPAAAISEIKEGENAGARVFELNLSIFPPELHTPRALAPVFRCTALPVFTTNRRYGRNLPDDFESLRRVDDGPRMQLQLDLIDVGSAGFDMELDTYDSQLGPSFASAEGIRYSADPTSPPRELTTDPRAIERQTHLVEEAHKRGGEILASAHTLTRTTTDDVLRICRIAEERGCDMLKIVRFCQSWEDVSDTLAQTVALRCQAKVPFVHMAMGEYGKITRLMTPLLGSMLCFCKHSYPPGAFTDQPLISAAKAVFDNVDFRIAPRAAEFTVDWYLRGSD